MPGRERDFQTEKERDSNTHRNKSDGNLFGHRRKFHWKRPWATRALSSVTPQKNALLPIIFSFTTLTLYGRLSHAKKQLRTLKKKQRFCLYGRIIEQDLFVFLLFGRHGRRWCRWQILKGLQCRSGSPFTVVHPLLVICFFLGVFRQTSLSSEGGKTKEKTGIEHTVLSNKI